MVFRGLRNGKGLRIDEGQWLFKAGWISWGSGHLGILDFMGPYHLNIPILI